MGAGEFAALAAAFCWASASLLYGRSQLSAWAMNFWKNGIASAILLGQMFVVSALTGNHVFTADLKAWIWLGLSGLVGITLGDTFYFRSLQILGPRQALVVSMSAPVFAAVLGVLLLGQQLSVQTAVGIVLTSVSVIWVVRGHNGTTESPGLYPGSVTTGTLCGILSALCQAFGAAFATMGLAGCDPLEGAFIRLAVAAVGGCVAVAVRGDHRTVLLSVREPTFTRRFVPAVLLGTWLGIWLSQIGYMHSTVAVTTTLLSTTPLFVIPLVRVFYGHRVTRAATAGTVLAVLGVYLVVS